MIQLIILGLVVACAIAFPLPTIAVLLVLMLWK